MAGGTAPWLPTRALLRLRLPAVVGLGLGLGGALLLAAIGPHYRIDAIRCASWPVWRTNLLMAGLYWLALALLSLGWLGLLGAATTDDGPSVRRVLGYAGLWYLVALLAPPFLSDDPLAYAASGRAMAAFAASPLMPLSQVLPSGDPFLQILDVGWRDNVSPYLPGFHLIERLVAQVGGSDLALHLRLYQGLAALAMLLCAAVTALALRGSGLRPAAGAALVALNPLSVIEATVSAHNDALLALGCALLVLAIRQQRRVAALLAVGLGLLIKASALIVGGIYVADLVLGGLRRRLPRLHRWLPGLLALGLLGGLLLLVVDPHALPGVSGLIGSPLAKYEYCTRSIECLPRALLRWVFHLPTVAWLVGLGFRLLGGGFLLSIAWRREDPLLGRLGLGLLIYYLYLHSWSQSWYFLSLLPLIPWAKPQHQPAMLIVCVSACAYYALVLIGNCFAADLPLAVTDLVEGLVVVVPPSISLWRRRATTALLAVAQPNTKEPADV